MKILAVFIIALLAGCGRGIEEGVVIRKTYEPANTFVSIIFLPISTGKTTTLMPIPYVMYDDADYVLRIQKDDKERSAYVTETLYNSVSKGDYVVLRDRKEVDFGDTPKRLKRAD